MRHRPGCWALVLGAALAGCAAPERGYYAPAGVDLGPSLEAYRESSDDAIVDLRCQGAYANEVEGDDALTIHLQLDVARPRSGDLRFRREAFVVDLAGAPGDPRGRLSLSEAWSKRERVDGDLVVPAWTRRPFDLFFDAPDGDDRSIPDRVLVRWTAEEGGRALDGQALFRRIRSGEPHAPSDEPLGDVAFGFRDGYYMPGALRLGPRSLRPSTEERMHYVFHQPSGWWRW
jgi:hypothetical protein